MRQVPAGFEKTVTKLDNGLVKVQIGRQISYHLGVENGTLHREDGPAFIGEDGYKQWIVNGKINRTIDSKGVKRWYDENAHLHREDGPAIEFPDGRVEYWLEGVRVKQLPLTNLLLRLLNKE